MINSIHELDVKVVDILKRNMYLECMILRVGGWFYHACISVFWEVGLNRKFFAL